MLVSSRQLRCNLLRNMKSVSWQHAALTNELQCWEIDSYCKCNGPARLSFCSQREFLGKQQELVIIKQQNQYRGWHAIRGNNSSQRSVGCHSAHALHSYLY